MRGSTQQCIVLLASLACLVLLAQARPPRKDDLKPDKKSQNEKLQSLKGDFQVESKWWTPEKKDTKDKKDGWKAFKLQKQTKKRWWEMDWHEEDWWSPKGSSSSNSVSSRGNSLNDKKGEGKIDSYSKSISPDAQLPVEKLQKETEKKKTAPEPKPLLQLSDSKTPQSEKLDYTLEEDDHKSEKSENKKYSALVYKKVKMPAAETPREKLDSSLKGDAMISPFEDPKPGPYNGPRDEVPSQEKWKYHQLSGFGKYIDQGKGKAVKEVNKEEMVKEEKISEEKDSDEEYLKEKVEKEIQAEEDNRVVEIPEEDKQKIVDQFYGFGLESGAAVPATSEKNKEVKKPVDVEVKKEAPEEHVKENYNKGIIYDVIPGSPDQTHSVKKDLSNSEYMKEFVSTKADLQTSPNPPPPGFAQEEGADSETTPPAPSKDTAKSEKPKFFVKSHPLTYCKLDGECRKGRMCRKGMCVCLPKEGCAHHRKPKPVCGSDDVEYPSHCELHRTACVTHVHIKIDHSGSCFMKHEKMQKMLQIQRDDYKDHLLPQPSSQTSDEDSEEDDDDDEDDYDDSDYDDEDDDDDDDDSEDDYEDEEDEEDEDEAAEEQKSDEGDSEDDDEDDIDKWLKSKIDKVKFKLDSKKIYDYSKDLKKASKTKTDQDDNKVDSSPWDHVQEERGQEFKGKGDKQDSKDMEGYQSDGSYKKCTKSELAKFKRQLLDYHCKRFEEPNCKLEVKEERQYLSNLIFSYLDLDTDYQLTHEELQSRQESEHFEDLNDICELTDLLWYDDVFTSDGHLSLDEFEEAFNHLDILENKKFPTEVIPAPSAPVVHVIPTLATVGNGLELKCGLAAKGADTVWRRNGVNIHDLAMVELLVLDDGSLFFNKMGVHHMGNYSCEDSTNPTILQVHCLRVQMPPIVKVSPHSAIEPTGADVRTRCHAEGVPKPTISWQMNNVPLHKEPHHYALEGNNELLVVYRADYQRDTGAYKCVAKNQAGTSEDVSSVFIIGDKERSLDMGFTSYDPGKFTVFHDQGFTVYDPINCLKYHNVHGDFGYFKFIPDNLDGPLRLCEDGQDCSWGEVVNIRNGFLYVTQPAMNRVVVIETSKNWIPVQVIATDKQPVQLHYVEHLDQVWVLCWNGEADESTKTIQVIRDASKYVQHRAVHTQPVGNHFDQIQALFIAPNNDLRHSFDYGYVTHNGQQGVTKLDLDNMRYVKAVDLSAYDCVPQSLAFVPIGGHVVVECVSPTNHQTLQLVMDYITDAVVSTAMLSGRPYVSPDSRHVVTVDDLTGKVSVAGVNNEGSLEAAYEVTVSASISDVSFFPTNGYGYLLVLTSADDDDIITINLSTGKVDKLKGTDRVASSSDWHPSPVKRSITSGDVFTDFLLAPSKSSISIIDVKFHRVKCEFTDIARSKAAAFIGLQ